MYMKPQVCLHPVVSVCVLFMCFFFTFSSSNCARFHFLELLVGFSASVRNPVPSSYPNIETNMHWPPL